MFLTLDEYWTIAEKMISKYGYNTFVNNDDCISYVVHYMITADQTFNGMGNRKGWRAARAIYAIKHLKTKYARKQNILSLNTELKHGDSTVDLHDLIKDNKQSVENIVMCNEIYNIAKKTLPPRQLQCFLSYYQDNMTLHNIGKEVNITREAVRQNIQKAIIKIRQCL